MALFNETLSDTGLAFSESFALSTKRTTADSAVTQTDTLRKSVNKMVTDIGTTFSDTFRISTRRVITSTGATVVDQFVQRATRGISTTGATVTDTLWGFQGVGRRDTDSFGRIESTRKWSASPNYTGWSTTATRKYELRVG